MHDKLHVNTYVELPASPQMQPAPANSKRRQWLKSLGAVAPATYASLSALPRVTGRAGLAGLSGWHATSLADARPVATPDDREQSQRRAESQIPAQWQKVIPGTGEKLPVIGMGTWITFNVGRDDAVRASRAQVLQAFFDAGGGVIDSSPMYGSAQAVVGDGLRRIGYRAKDDNPRGPANDAVHANMNLFSATKVWTGSAGQGPQQIAQASTLWGLDRFDLLQVHNLLNWQDHLPHLFAMKAAGKLRYVGITTSHGRRHSELETLMKNQPVDFVQLTYHVANRDVEQRLLPLAKEKGIAVIANRPFQRGALPNRLQSKPLPAIAAALQCDSWAQLLLKFVVSHPAVTCAIPATSRVDHMIENMRAGLGPRPDKSQRQQILRAIDAA